MFAALSFLPLIGWGCWIPSAVMSTFTGRGGRIDIRKLAICTMHEKKKVFCVRLDWNFSRDGDFKTQKPHILLENG